VYVRFGSVPEVGWLLYGVKPVILGVVVQAIWGLASKAARTLQLRLLAGLIAVLDAVGVHELLLLFGAGAVAVLGARLTRASRHDAGEPLHELVPIVSIGGAGVGASAVTLPGLFGVFFKIGAILFGSGYVLLAFLRADLVERLHWLSESQLIDAVAVGQVTPGPVFTTATFIGYVLAGPTGALVATAGIFLPAFIFVALSGSLVPKLRGSATAGAFLDGVNVASLALMAVVTIQLGRAALLDLPTVSLACIAAALLVRFKSNATWLVLGGAAAGWALHAVGLAR